MLAGSVGDNGAIDGLAIESDALHTLLGAVRMDGNLVFCLTELTAYGLVAGCFGQTGINSYAVVVVLDAQYVLADCVTHPGGGSCEP